MTETAHASGRIRWIGTSWKMNKTLAEALAFADALSLGARPRRVFVDRRPTFSATSPTPGDFVARGEGTCTIGEVSTRWAYFVAAPGYGPVREVGIPASGLYVVIAVTPENDRASALLNRLIAHTSFGGSSVRALLDAADGAQIR